MLQPNLHLGIRVPIFWEENQIMKTNLFVHFKKIVSHDRNFWLGGHRTGAFKCISNSVFEVTAFGMGDDCGAETEVIKQLWTFLILSTSWMQ